MFKKLIAPIFVSTIFLTFLTLMGLNYDLLAQNNESEQDYFLKPILSSNLVVVEPNYGHFYNPNRSIEGDASGDKLYRSLEDLGQNYEIKGTKMVRFERKGKMIPNLYVYVDSPSLDIADTLSYEQDSLAVNFDF